MVHIHRDMHVQFIVCKFILRPFTKTVMNYTPTQVCLTVKLLRETLTQVCLTVKVLPETPTHVRP